MHSRSRLLLLVLLLVAGTLALPWVASAQEPVTSRLQMSIGGYIKPEILYKTDAGGPSVAGNPEGVSNFGFTPVPQKNTLAGGNGTFSLNANESRINFTMTAPDWRGLKPSAFMEMDFAGNDSGIIGYCPTEGSAALSGSPCAAAQNGVGSPQTSDFGYGGFRMRHAYFQLAGEGMGGSWKLIAGQTWGIMGMLPYYSGSTLSFGGGGVWGQRQPQFTFVHTLPLTRDLRWINTVGIESDTTFFNESPQYAGSSRMEWAGWQGWNGGVRSPLHFGISGYNQREKAEVEAPTGATNGPVRALNAQTWGYDAGLFIPILPGVSATDRTWALSVVADGGTGSGANGMVPNAAPLPGGVLVGANNIATPQAVYFNPSSCSGNTGGGTVVGGTNPCPAGQMPTKLDTVRSDWAGYNVQFYLPWNFWLSVGQRWMWFNNVDNAVAQTCNVLNSGAACTAANGGLVTPVVQGNWNPALGGAVQCIDSQCFALNSSRDGLITRMSYSWAAVFYDMTPNIRWGFEFGVHDTNRKNSNQSNQSERVQFGAYYFF